jgi:hypothetical protein
MSAASKACQQLVKHVSRHTSLNGFRGRHIVHAQSPLTDISAHATTAAAAACRPPGKRRCRELGRFRLLRQHTSAYVSIRQLKSASVGAANVDTSACVSIRQHTSAYVSKHRCRERGRFRLLHILHALCHCRLKTLCQHTSAYVSIRQHTSSYVSMLYVSAD